MAASNQNQSSSPFGGMAGPIERHPTRTGGAAVAAVAGTIAARKIMKRRAAARAVTAPPEHPNVASHPSGSVGGDYTHTSAGGPSASSSRVYGPPKPAGMEIVRNSTTRGPRTVIGHSAPRPPAAPIHPDAPIASVHRAVGDVQATRAAARKIGGDIVRSIPVWYHGMEGAVREGIIPGPDLSGLPARGSVPKMRNAQPKPTNRGQFHTSRQNAAYGGMSPGEKGALRRQTNKAAAAAKPVQQQAFRTRFAVEPPVVEKKARKPRTPKTPKAPAATTVEIVPHETPTPPSPSGKKSSGGKKKAASAEVEVKRNFQPGRLPGETNAQKKARHKAEHAADQAAKRAANKGKPKNTTKAPPSVEIPSPVAESNPRSSFALSHAESANQKTASLTPAQKGAARRASNKAAAAAKPVQQGAFRARFGGGGSPSEFKHVVIPSAPAPASPNDAAWGTKRLPGETKEQASARRKAKHAAEQAEKRAAKKAGGASAGAAARTVAPSSAKPSGFVSTFIPQERTHDLFTARLGGGKVLGIADTPEKVKWEMHTRTSRHMYSKKGPSAKTAKLPPIEEATVRQFPPIHSPHMTGPNPRLIGEQGNFRVYQGKKRTETVLQHRSGRQINLPDNPSKHGPVNPGRILDFSNKGNNEKAFLKGGWSKGVPKPGGDAAMLKSRTGRFLIGASKRGGLMAAGATALALGAKFLGPIFDIADTGPGVAKAGESTKWLGEKYAKQAAHTKNRAQRHALQHKAVEVARGGGVWIEPSQYKAITKKYGTSPLGHLPVVNTSGAFAKNFPGHRYRGK